ncbi:sirohydrochlorin cobaltochelatase [Pelotomaculum terephthalicicum JT]|uniref:sirohydrochlorin chelatase n=1 Tax=Pelotomaculum TaxID=191373 RepID=UPI0009D3E533|nr:MULTISPECIES: CbiX/SirB N-terminal domain-containing protein [Pelotomaculum]MCG9967317.1 sirohydrochlorin cobaltochelatase [Pelotomaculum terephthalicicum JT]OPX89399.1 MAG: Sirohydrochlorin cobaltochelatase [Pelotomaculum sp. PtaB.Bin117]OPY61788.1 MAG: Sirohydrochlorin cobaltochelatase [Pelotomaculum sp. PtaU1.Bin065]
MQIGIVVLGHGSRAVVDEANEVLLELSNMIKANNGFQLLETAFMNPESGRPGLEEAVYKLIGSGAKKIIVAPVFISNGIHMQKDIPVMIEQLKAKYEVEIKCAAHMGADAKIAEIVSERIREVV